MARARKTKSLQTPVRTTNAENASHVDHYVHERLIARRAYERYLARGLQHGRDLDDWLKAEGELRRQGGPLSARVRELFAAGEAMKPEAFAAFFTEDGRYRFGNGETLIGRVAIRDSVAQFFPLVKALYHDIRTMWEWDTVVILEMEVVYTRHNGSEIALPCADVFRFRGELIDDMRIYMDAGPLLA